MRIVCAHGTLVLQPIAGLSLCGGDCARLCAGTGLPFPAAEPGAPATFKSCLFVDRTFIFLGDLTSPKNGFLQGGRSFKQFIRVNKMELTPIIRRPLIRYIIIIECSSKVHWMVFE